MTIEQKYYELLVRTDHPVFKKDFSQVTDSNSPLNSIINRVIAKQFVKMREDLEDLKLNINPHTTNKNGIDSWEETFFGFTKQTITLEQRRDELLKKRNTQPKMNVASVIAAAEAITGKTPIVIRNLFFGGWVLGEAALGVDTVFSGGDQAIDGSAYLVIFTEPIDSNLLDQLDKELTLIEKVGSRHFIQAPLKLWTLGESALGIDTVLE